MATKEKMCTAGSDHGARFRGEKSWLYLKSRKGRKVKGTEQVAIDREHFEEYARKRVRLSCPVCGRRLLAWMQMGHDGDFQGYTLPPHKVKGWWKKKTKTIHDKSKGPIKWRSQIGTRSR